MTSKGCSPVDGFKDWRGTPIEPGVRVLTHPLSKGYTPKRGIGTVRKVDASEQKTTPNGYTYGNVWIIVDLIEHSGGYANHARVLKSNVTVLTPDMLESPHE